MNFRFQIGTDSLGGLRKWIADRNYSSVFILTDSNTAKYCYPEFVRQSATDPIKIEITAGEKNKNISSCEKIWRELIQKGADRKSLLINLGGGMITDLGGFCASVFMRGIDYVNVPTSLLAMVDAAVGGKTAVDFDSYKNLVGSFYEAQNTFIYPSFLKTLPVKELKAAFGEIIKYNLLLPFSPFKELFTNFATIPDEELIRTCINSKFEVVREDPFETKFIREILNLGHTFGHAFETSAMEKQKVLLHGEAVALGLVAEMILSENIFKLNSEQNELVKEFVLANFDRSFITDSDILRVAAIIKTDKKNVDGKCRFILIDDHGKIKPVFVPAVDIIKALDQFINL